MARAPKIRATLAVQLNTSQGNARRTLRAKAKEQRINMETQTLVIANGVICTLGQQNRSGTDGGQGKDKEEKQEESHRFKAKDNKLLMQEPTQKEIRWNS